jgi:pimeloyl-ACP methyl ester carboxylesterase
MTCENLTADADALRQRLGFEKWAVLGHSFGGKVALEYALRYPGSLSHLILLDTGGDSWWDQANAPELLARRWFNGQIAPWEFYPTLMRLRAAYDPYTSFLSAVRTMVAERREGRAGGGDLRLRSADEGLEGHEPAQRDQGAHAGDGWAGRLRGPGRASGSAGGRDP